MSNVTPFGSLSSYTVHVTHKDGVWTGVCEEIGLVTEAKTREAIIERVHMIAPELCRVNGLCEWQNDNVRFVS